MAETKMISAILCVILLKTHKIQIDKYHYTIFILIFAQNQIVYVLFNA